MKYVAIVLACLLVGAAPSCFRPQLSCGGCGKGRSCPSGLICRTDNLCVYDLNERCKSPFTVADGSAEMATGGAGMATGGAGGMAGMEPVVPTGGGPGGAAGSRAVACIDHCCIGENDCLNFPPTLKDGLLFWGDRISMGEPGFPLTAWQDRSRYANDVVPVMTNAATPPRVQLYERGAVVRIDQPSMVIASKDAPATAFGADDFTILVLARCEVEAPRSCVFRQAKSGERPLMSVALYCNSAGEPILTGPLMYTHAELRVTDDNVALPNGAATLVSRRTDLNNGMHLFGARRMNRTKLQLRVDGDIEGEMDIPEKVNLDYLAPISLGSCAPTTPLPPLTTLFKGELGAAVVVHGNLSEDEVRELETFLIKTRAAAAP